MLALEDVHWADPTTLDVLRGVAERGALAPLLVLVTARPEFRPSWGMRSHHVTISLAPLDRRQVREMVAELSARHALPHQIVDSVTARTGGVPLFVEEVTRLLLERGDQGDVQAIPPTLQQSLMARLDRLGPAREVAQIGAVIGRDFSYALLHAVAVIDDELLQTALERLAVADILLVQGLPPEAHYRFKHALIQDAAYENLLKSRRQVFHRRVAELLRDQLGDSASVEPELFAHHFTQAGLTEAAIQWWATAGQRSLERSALLEAVEQFSRALGQIAILPPTHALRREEIKLQIALITPLIHIKGYAAPETKAAAERARLLIEQAEEQGEAPEDPMLLLSVIYSFWVASNVTFDGATARNFATQFFAIANKQGTTAPLMMAHRLMGNSLLLTGQISEGRGHLEQALSLYDHSTHRPLATRFGQDVRVAALSYRALALWLLGYPEAALTDIESAIKDAREIAQAATLMYALFHGVLIHMQSRNYAAANLEGDELAALANEKGSLFWATWAKSLQGCLAILAGEPADAIEMIASSLALGRSTGTTMYAPLSLSQLAKAHAHLGQFDEAWRYTNEAMAAVEISEERWFKAELYRTAGEVALSSPKKDAAKAEAHFENALTVARQQQAKSWELRAATSMARTLARARENAAGSRTARSSLRLVHRGL